MFESRYGVRCSQCKRKEKVNCSGCLQMLVPFWGGICEVKACCENRKLDYCSQCALFSCAMLANMGKSKVMTLM